MDPQAELEHERATLAKAERDIDEGGRRVAEQGQLVERLRDGARPTETADALLATLRGTLEGWRAHRRSILQRIAYLQESARTDREAP